MGRVTDAATAERVKSGDLRGLSLGTDCVQAMDGTVLSRAQRELSLCEEGRRSGTWITELNGQKVHEVACFSAKGENNAKHNRYHPGAKPKRKYPTNDV
jgi:hypothetical protein